MSSVGSGGARSGTNTGSMLIHAQAAAERSLSADQIIQELRPKFARCWASMPSCRIRP